MRHFSSIQCLRGVAAMLVFMTHMGNGGFHTGGAGVDIFFVVSGFIMGTVGTHDRPGAFLVKRLIRVAPLYWLVTAVMCVGAALGLFSSLTVEPAHVWKSLLFIPYYAMGDQIFPIVVPGWTLNYEMFFYVVFAAGLFVGRPIVFCVAALSAAIALGPAAPESSAPLAVWTSPLLLEFMAGLLLSRAARLPGWPAGLTMAGLGAVLLAAGAWFDLPAWNLRALTWGVPAFLMVAGCLAVERAGVWPAALRPLEKLGDASYSLYLWHGLVIAAAARLFGASLPAEILTFFGTLAFAHASFLLFEKPAGRWLSKTLFGQRRPGPASPLKERSAA